MPHASRLALPLVLAAVLVACDGGDPASTGAGGAGGDASPVATGTGSGTSGDGGGPSTSGVVGSTSGAGGAEPTGAGAGGDGGSGGGDGCPRVRATVDPGVPLNVRPDPSTANPPVGTLQSGQIVDVVAQVEGESLEGNALWFQIAAPWVEGFVWSGFAECTLDLPPDPPDGFYLPLACGTSATVSQGNNSPFSHNRGSAWAFDFALEVGVPMVAMAAGTVRYLYDLTEPGDPCYDGGDASCIDQANYVVVEHADATQTLYAHLSQVAVSVGQVVARGEIVGFSGSSGWSTGPHAHVQRENACGSAWCGSIPLEFVDAGVPVAGDVVTSMNCPE